jgi:hypothetical protein
MKHKNLTKQIVKLNRNQEMGSRRDFPKKKGNKQTSKTHEEEETNLAPIHYVQCGMEAESTCQCQSSSSKHREIHHDLVSGTEKERMGPKINYWEL